MQINNIKCLFLLILFIVFSKLIQAQSNISFVYDSLTVQFADKDELKWSNPKYNASIEKKLHELIEKIDPYNQKILNLALYHYSKGRGILLQLHKEFDIGKNRISVSKKKKWYHEKLSGKKLPKQKILDKIRNTKIKAVAHYSKTIHLLNEIEYNEIKNLNLEENFIIMKLNIYREWIILQFDLGNKLLCIDKLNEYLYLDSRFVREISPHKILVECYHFAQDNSINFKWPEQKYEYWGRKKNEQLYKAAKLKYNKNSKELKNIIKKIEKEESYFYLWDWCKYIKPFSDACDNPSSPFY
jgi:hypothetical protein